MCKNKIRKILVLSDLHISHKPQWRLDRMRQWAGDMFFKSDLVRIGSDIDAVVFTGDVFEIPNRNDNEAYCLFTHMMSGLSDIEYKIWITGQHDLEHNSFRLGFLNDYGLGVVCNEPNTEIFSYSDQEGNFIAIPYCRDVELYRKWIKEKGKDKIVFTHMPCSDFIPAKVNQNDFISIADFSECKRVISGDLHYHENKGNFTYAGCPFPRDFRDELPKGKQNGGIGVFDVEQNTFTLLENKYAYQMRTINTKEELDEVKKSDDAVCLRLDAETDLMEHNEEWKSNILDVSWKTQKVDHSDIDVLVSPAGTVSPLNDIKKYVDESIVIDKPTYIHKGEEYINGEENED